MSNSNDVLRTSDISWERKLKFLMGMTEDQFRDRVIRPVFERQDLVHIRRTCGPEEEGKDCCFSGFDALGRRMIYAVQAKKGQINMTSKATENLHTAIAQLRTALETDVLLVETREKVRPDVVMLVASGTINQAARKYIVDELKDRRLEFIDSQDLIPKIDRFYSELWYGIDAKLFPYLRKLKQQLLSASDTVISLDLGPGGKAAPPITDDSYVTLYVHRVTEEVTRSLGQVKVRPKLDQIHIGGLLKRRDKLIWIRGEGGSGKTTALRRIAYELIQQSLSRPTEKHLVPVILNAATVFKHASNPTALPMEATCEVTGEDHAALTVEDLENGKAVLLIDALDEVATTEMRQKVIDALVGFSNKYPECYIFLTSRDYRSIGTLSGLNKFIRYQLTKLDMRQASKIVDRMASGRRLPKEETAEMLRRLQDVHGIALSPMLVTVFVATSDLKRKDIPPNITEIFEKYTELMLGRWDERKGLSQQYEWRVKAATLAAVAADMHRSRIRELSAPRFRAIASEYLARRGYKKEAEAVLDEILSRSNLLRVDDEVVLFRHHIIQEYFAGRGVLDSNQFASVIWDEWWRKAVVFHFGGRPDGAKALVHLQTAAEGLNDVQKYEAAVTIGLSAQASYLSDVEDKKASLRWVITALAATCEQFTTQPGLEPEKYPQRAFLTYYLLGRDAVASDLIAEILPALNDSLKTLDGDGSVQAEREHFWATIGLMESGDTTAALEEIRKKEISDPRLLLAIHVGAFHIANLRISTVEQKKAAELIIAQVEPKVKFLMNQVIKEYNGYLIELRDNKPTAVQADGLVVETAGNDDSEGGD